MYSLILTPGSLSLSQLHRIYREPVVLQLDENCGAAIHRSAQTVTDILAQDRPVYGINTGFGLLARQRIANDDLQELQRKLVLSHACGTGDLLSDAQVRLMLALKINSLARGYSGIRLSVIEALIKLLNTEIYPCIPAKGSVGASGDLAPLAHMSAALLGVGEVRHNGELLPATEGLKLAGLTPLELGPKEGLALLNGTQTSTALALSGLFSAEMLFNNALTTGALSVDAALGSDAPFDPRIQAIRGHRGQREVAAAYTRLLADSEIRQSHSNCERVQDPYSLRCQPQVMGACLDNLYHAAAVLTTEANAVSDNPLVFSQQGEILSGGNFHAEPVAIVADLIAICIAEIGALSERRTALLIDSHLSELPPFLVSNGGINSGFMIAQVTAAALASENKSLAHPASVDSLPTSANQEDHVSMATFAARRLQDMADNTAGVLAVELLAACQGIDLRAPLKTSPALQLVLYKLREKVPHYREDRFFAPDIAAAKALITTATLAKTEELGISITSEKTSSTSNE
jgi:histidine ammonia-lyase